MNFLHTLRSIDGPSCHTMCSVDEIGAFATVSIGSDESMASAATIAAAHSGRAVDSLEFHYSRRCYCRYPLAPYPICCPSY